MDIHSKVQGELSNNNMANMVTSICVVVDEGEKVNSYHHHLLNFI
jgi:hypothetical protein